MVNQDSISVDETLDKQNIKAAWRLACFVEHECHFENKPQLSDAIDWMALAYNVEKVDVAPNRFDESIFWCDYGWQREYGISSVLTECATLLTRFLFVWGAFESVAHTNESVTKESSKSIVSGVRNCLRDADSSFSDEEETVLQLYSEIDKVEQFRHELQKFGIPTLEQEREQVNLGDAVFYVSKIRNHLAHGSLRLSTYENQSGEYDCATSNRVLIYSTRVALMAIARILSSQIEEDYELDAFYGGASQARTAHEYLCTVFQA